MPSTSRRSLSSSPSIDEFSEISNVVEFSSRSPQNSQGGSSPTRSSNPPRAASESLSIDHELDSGDEDEEQNIRRNLNTVSFGTLAKIQPPNTQPIKSRHPDSASVERLSDLRTRLSAFKPSFRKRKVPESPKSPPPRQNAKRPKKDEPARSSKHAPHSQSSKKPVSRFRVPMSESMAAHDHTVQARDPRFDSATIGTLDREGVRRRYKFLEDYEEREVDELKESLTALAKQGKSKRKKRPSAEVEGEIDRLKREIGSRENRVKTRKKLEHQQEVKAEMKRREKEAVRMGKKPFYLKSGKLKGVVDEKRVERMKAGEREKLERRRTKKENEKEARRLNGVRDRSKRS